MAKLLMTRACEDQGRHIGYVSPVPMEMRTGGSPARYEECGGTWTQYPEDEGKCECPCHVKPKLTIKESVRQVILTTLDNLRDAESVGLIVDDAIEAVIDPFRMKYEAPTEYNAEDLENAVNEIAMDMQTQINAAIEPLYREWETKNLD